ncbi:MAG TPA: hypothetical protein VF237_06480 [Xanthobacteraceae bacterium]|jgi:hypothetical protein
MTVIAFQPKVLQLDGPWRTGELNTIVERLAPESSRGGARRWDVGITDIGDPQFYLLGPPHDECILCISRLGRLYVLEDGHGQLLFEHNSLLALAEQARVVLQKKKTQIVARVALVWCAVRETIEEKLDAVVVEGEELLAHYVPQLAALA